MEKKKIFTRYTAITILIIALFALISLRLVDMQIVNGEDYRTQAQDSSIRTVDDDAPRGKILDRNGTELATNVQSYTVFMMKPQDQQDKKNLMLVIERLVDILDKDNEKIKDDFPIVVSKDDKGKYVFEFDFPYNGTDEKKRQDYIDKASKRWKKELQIKSITEDMSAEDTFRKLVEYYEVNPVNQNHKVNKDGTENIQFIRQMLVVRQMVADMGYMAYKPVEIAYVSKSTAFEIMEKALYLPGVDTKLKPLRTYPYGDLASLVIGSLRKIPGGTDAQKYKDKHYDVNSDLIGRDGIEAYAEDDLRGEKGGRTVKVDALGRIIDELGKREPVPGNNIVLTLDKNLQQVAEQSLDSVMKRLQNGELDNGKKFPNATRGAAVVIDIHNGEVLAMASRPGGYDPNIMAATGSFNEEVRKKLIPLEAEHPGVDGERIAKPMYNYATMSHVPPGSTFKMVSAIAGLETGNITSSTIINDVGQYRVVPNFPGNCWIWNTYHGAHGPLNVIGALKVSCNYFFFEVGRRVGLENLTKYANLFGLKNEPTGIEIGEDPGNVADRTAVKKKAVDFAYYMTLKDISKAGYDPAVGTFNPTDDQKKIIFNMIDNNIRDTTQLKSAGVTSYKIRMRIVDGVRAASYDYNNAGLPLNAAIGQGDDAFTPLQIANYIATIANGGTRYRPHLVKKIVKPDGTVVKDIQAEVLNQVSLKPTTLPTVIAGMDAVTGEGGTAGNAFRNFSIKTAGKTGTAQASIKKDDYSWFAGFAPADNPQIAVAVVIHEGGGHGGADVARAIYEQYFGLNSAQTAPTPTPTPQQ